MFPWGAVTAMTATPPEPDNPQGGHDLPPEPPTIQAPVYRPPAYQPQPAPPPYPPPAYQPSAFPPPSAYQPPDYQPSAFPPPPDPSPQDLRGPSRPRKMSVLRIITGVVWAAIAVICAVGAVAEWRIGLHAAAVLCLVIAVGSGWYDYRVWTFKARRFIV
jgi:hypothetical protein